MLGASHQNLTVYFQRTDPGVGAGLQRCPDPMELIAQSGGCLKPATSKQSQAVEPLGKEHNDLPEMNEWEVRSTVSGGPL